MTMYKITATEARKNAKEQNSEWAQLMRKIGRCSNIGMYRCNHFFRRTRVKTMEDGLRDLGYSFKTEKRDKEYLIEVWW